MVLKTADLASASIRGRLPKIQQADRSPTPSAGSEAARRECLDSMLIVNQTTGRRPA
jgi:hypothetical protein